jgi:hypothetical protein
LAEESEDDEKLPEDSGTECMDNFHMLPDSISSDDAGEDPDGFARNFARDVHRIMEDEKLMANALRQDTHTSKRKYKRNRKSRAGYYVNSRPLLRRPNKKKKRRRPLSDASELSSEAYYESPPTDLFSSTEVDDDNQEATNVDRTPLYRRKLHVRTCIRLHIYVCCMCNMWLFLYSECLLLGNE